MHVKRASALTAMATVVFGGLLAGGTVAEVKPGAPTPCAPTAKACVSQSTNQTWLQEDGKATYGPVPNTVGKPGAETPNGTFQVQFKDADHRSGEFDNAPMPNAVFFTNTGVAFHEGSLENESNGCIHMSTTGAQKFFDNLEPGDEVQVVP